MNTITHTPELHGVSHVNTDVRAEYTEPTLVRHGTIGDITQNIEGSGGDGGDPDYNSSVPL